MPIKSAQEMFTDGLSKAYCAEQVLLQGMQEMQRMAQNDRVKQMLSDHIKESQQQVKYLDQAFTELGARPQSARCHAAEGLVEDFRSTAKQIQDPRLVDIEILGAMDKVEHFETAEYRCLVNEAKLMGNARVAQILDQVRSGEEREAQLVEKTFVDLGKQAISRPGIGGISV